MAEAAALAGVYPIPAPQADEVYGAATGAVAAFQKLFCRPADPRVGALTWDRMMAERQRL